MKITFVMAKMDMGGGSRVIAVHAQKLADRGHDVTVVVAPAKADRLLARLKSGAWMKVRENPSIEEIKADSHFAACSFNVRLARQAGSVRAHDLPDADVVIATWWETVEWVLALPASKGMPVSFVQHHEVFDYLPVERARKTYRAPIYRIAIAAWLVQVMRNEYGCASVDLVPNAVDHAVFHAPPRGKQRCPTVGFLQSTTPFKGVPVTLEALRSLRRQFPDLRILSFGLDGIPNFEELNEVVHFESLPTQARIREIYSQCDAWLTASTSEGFNLPAMEAMACRTPVVSTRTGWPAEGIEDGVNGYLVEVNDAKALAVRAAQLLALSEDRWFAMSEQAFACASRYSWDESSRLFEWSLERARQQKS